MLVSNLGMIRKLNYIQILGRLSYRKFCVNDNNKIENDLKNKLEKVDINNNSIISLPENNKKIWKFKTLKSITNCNKITNSEVQTIPQEENQLSLPFKENLKSFFYKNNLNYNLRTKNQGDDLFLQSEIKLVHYLDDRNINDFKDGVKENNYEFYDVYKDVPEFLFLGRSNVGKSSLINNLFGKKVTLENKRPGRTQRLEFYIFGKKGHLGGKTLTSKSIYSKLKSEPIIPKGFLIDAPGFGWVDGPVVLKRKFKYLIYSYLNYAVRLNLIIYLINGENGMTPIDKEEIQFLNNFNKHIQLVFTKVDKFGDNKLIQFITEASQFTRDLQNVRTEILLTSSRSGYGIKNLRSHLFMDFKEIDERKSELLEDKNLLLLNNISDIKI